MPFSSFEKPFCCSVLAENFENRFFLVDLFRILCLYYLFILSFLSFAFMVVCFLFCFRKLQMHTVKLENYEPELT